MKTLIFLSLVVIVTYALQGCASLPPVVVQKKTVHEVIPTHLLYCKDIDDRYILELDRVVDIFSYRDIITLYKNGYKDCKGKLELIRERQRR